MSGRGRLAPSESTVNLTEFLSNRYVVAVLVPALFLLAQSIGRKLVRGTEWQITDAAVGADALLTAMSITVVQALEAIRAVARAEARGNGSASDRDVIAPMVFTVVTFVVYLIVLGVHQDWEKDSKRGAGRAFRLLGAAALGLFFLGVSILGLQRVEP